MIALATVKLLATVIDAVRSLTASYGTQVHPGERSQMLSYH